MGETVKIVILAIIQGIAEFLPISSSGHLAVLSRLFDIHEDTAMVVVVLHAGTLVAIVVYYFQELLSLLKPGRQRVIMLLMIGTVPTGAIGVMMELTGLARFAFNTLGLVAVCFYVTALLLLYGERKAAESVAVPLEKLSVLRAAIVGCVQGLAIFPGVSRSGSTIAAGMRVGLTKEDAATFSFLLAIPAIGGASLLKLMLAIRKYGVSVSEDSCCYTLAIGFVISAIVGYFCLWLLLRILKKGKLHYFAYYCLALGTGVMIWQVILLF